MTRLWQGESAPASGVAYAEALHLAAVPEFGRPSELTALPATTSSDLERARRVQLFLNVLGWGLFLVMAAYACSQAFAGVAETQDEGILLTYPWLISQGKMLYRDVWSLYPPSVYLLLAGAIKAGIPGLVAERALSVSVRLGFALLVNRLVGGSWKRFSFVATPACFSLLALYAQVRAAAVIVGIPLLLVGLVGAERRPYWSAGFFFAAATFRYEFGVAGVGTLTVLAVLLWIYGRDSASAIRAALLLALVLVSFFGALAVLTGGQALDQMFVEPVRAIAPYVRLPLLPIQYSPWDLELVALIVAGPLALLVAGLVKQRPQLTASSIGVMALLPYFLQRADRAHLYPIAALVIPWLLVQLESLSGEGARSRRVRAAVRLWFGLGIGWWYMIIVLSVLIYNSPLSPLAGFNGTLPVVGRGEHMLIAPKVEGARYYREVLGYLDRHRSPQARVFVAPAHLQVIDANDVSLYVALGMTPATRYLEFNPGVVNQDHVQRDIIRHLRGCQWIVLWKPYLGVPPRAGDPGMPLLKQYIASHYRSVLQNAGFEVLRPRHDASTEAGPHGSTAYRGSARNGLAARAK